MDFLPDTIRFVIHFYAIGCVADITLVADREISF
jgi:hypothetical protein